MTEFDCSDLSLSTLINDLKKYDPCSSNIPTAHPVDFGSGEENGHIQPVTFTPNPELEHLAKNCSSTFQKNFLCPFCSNHFNHEMKLKRHIDDYHATELDELDVFIRRKCPFCYAFFYKEAALLRHLMEDHQSSILYPVIHKSFRNTKEQYQCLACSKYFRITSSISKIFNHIEKNHLEELESALKSMISILSETRKVNQDGYASFSAPVSSTPNLGPNVGSSRRLNFPVRNDSDCGNNHFQTPTNVLHAKIKGNRIFPQKGYPKVLKYRCMECKQQMTSNCSLLIHVKAKHKKSIRAFKPMYGCGLCPARFYMYRYLIKHMKSH